MVYLGGSFWESERGKVEELIKRSLSRKAKAGVGLCSSWNLLNRWLNRRKAAIVTH